MEQEERNYLQKHIFSIYVNDVFDLPSLENN